VKVSGPIGFGNPVSPKGLASLVENPPHHISADAIQVNFRVDPKIVNPYLPEGLSLTDDCIGYVYVADMVKVSASHPGQEFDEPQRTQYNEGLVGFYVKYDNVPGRFSAFIWVSEEWSLVFGHYMGFAKKQAEVFKTKLQPANPGLPKLGVGTRLRGQVDRFGTRIVDMGITLTEKLPDDGIPSYGHRIYTYRYLPSPSPDVPDSQQLFGLNLGNATTINVWKGEGFVNFQDGSNEELEAFQPTEIVSAYYFQRGWTTDTTAELIKDYSK
jgi:hypothetical protein